MKPFRPAFKQSQAYHLDEGSVAREFSYLFEDISVVQKTRSGAKNN